MRLIEEIRVIDQRHLVADHRHAHPQGVIDRRVPAGVAPGQVIVDRDQVGALALERVQVKRQHRDQRLAFARLHLGDLPLVQHDAAHRLDVEVAEADRPAGRLPDHGEGLDQQVIESVSLCQLIAELGRLRLQLIIGELLHERLELIDVGYPLQVTLDFARVRIA